MSRVDEALRRAREREDGAVEGDPAVDHPLLADTAVPADLTREAFPIEMPDRRPRPRPEPSANAPSNGSGTTTRGNGGGTSSPADVKPPKVDRAGAKPLSAPSLLQRVDQRVSEKLIVDDHMLPASREQYRRLAAALHHLQMDGLSVVMIASAVQGEGKTLTASNLALTFSESYQRNVLLIDADLRRPTLDRLFGVPNVGGLTEGLMSAEEPTLQARQLSSRLCLLPAGRPTTDPMAGLTSSRMKRLLEEARESFDWVIIDTPPVGLLPDAGLLGAMVDGAVLVIKAGSTPFDLVKRAVDTIGRNKIVGTVLNRAERGAFTAHDEYYAGYEYAASVNAK